MPQKQSLSPDEVTDRHLRNLTEGKLRVAPNLYFRARDGRRPAWEFLYTSPCGGKQRSLTLGKYPDLGLAEARKRAAEHRQQVHDGIDPLEARKATQRRAEQEREQRVTLREAAQELHDLMLPTWRNDKHAKQWLSSLNHLGALLDRPLGEVDSAALLAPLEVLNRTHHETAKRIRQRVEAVYDRAIIQGRVRDNPAKPLIRSLRAPKKVKHHPSIHYNDLPALLARIRDGDAHQSTRLGLEWLILTAARTSEVRYATWRQIEEDHWAPPEDAADNKQRAPWPVTWRMREILSAMEAQRGEEWDWIFPSPQRRVQPLSDSAFLAVLYRMGLKGTATSHGMRRSYSTWAYSTQPVRSEVIEASLGHREDDAVKAAYNYADYWEQRVALAKAWTDYLYGRRVTEN